MQIATQFGVSQQQISKPAKTASKKPYRLSSRTALTPEPPFTVELTRKLLAEATKGRVVQLDDQVIGKLISVLVARHRLFLAAQEDRERAARRDRAVTLIRDLRTLMPGILADVERLTDDFFTRHTKAAAKQLHDVITSDAAERALPQLNLSATSWHWVAPSLAADLVPCLGTSATVRFLTAAIPFLSGEHPKATSIEVWLRQHKIAA